MNGFDKEMAKEVEQSVAHVFEHMPKGIGHAGHGTGDDLVRAAETHERLEAKTAAAAEHVVHDAPKEHIPDASGVHTDGHGLTQPEIPTEHIPDASGVETHGRGEEALPVDPHDHIPDAAGVRTDGHDVDYYESQEAVRREVADLRALRQSNGNPTFSRKKNLAAARIDLDGAEPRTLRSVSGDTDRDGLVPETPSEGNPQRFDPPGTGDNDRTSDTEYKLLTRIANDLGPGSPTPHGTIYLHTELPACTSCQSVIEQFEKQFPNVKVVLSNGKG